MPWSREPARGAAAPESLCTLRPAGGRRYLVLANDAATSALSPMPMPTPTPVLPCPSPPPPTPPFPYPFSLSLFLSHILCIAPLKLKLPKPLSRPFPCPPRNVYIATNVRFGSEKHKTSTAKLIVVPLAFISVSHSGTPTICSSL